ncbi:EF0163 family protein [Enterococcus sp. 5B3_DIV0040]|uniref:EF0163 family protein n=1 Tax=Enterococcus sp. 5B3_DIV0040 TaxID=1834182 RepID=UPI0034E8A923
MQRATTGETIESTEDVEISSEELVESSISISQSSQSKEAQIEKTTKSFLKDFARKWSNFTDVYKCNQTVREYMTERCIQDNSIDADPHVEIKTTGKLHQITQDVDNPDQYLLFGEEHANDVIRFVLLQVKVVEQKVDAIKVYYVRSVY